MRRSYYHMNIPSYGEHTTTWTYYHKDTYQNEVNILPYEHYHMNTIT